MEPSFDKQFAEWLGRVSDADMPPPFIVAYNIGLYETPEGYSAT